MQKGIEAMNKELEMVRLACKAMDEKKACLLYTSPSPRDA